jgi:hypothetical protein
MEFEKLIINNIIIFLDKNILSLKDINRLNGVCKDKILSEIYKSDLKKWKKKIVSINIDIESNFWKMVQITSPIFNVNTFTSHYLDILITKKNDDRVIIYQYHNPLWEIYYQKALDFKFKLSNKSFK